MPTSTFAQKIADIAAEQWTFFGSQAYDISGHTIHMGHLEGEDGWYQRIGQYWVEGTNTHGIDGRNHDSPWSATFISWVVKTGGAATRFRYSIQHSVYISQAIRDRLQNRQAAGYWAFRLHEMKPTVGDIVCWAREPGVDYDHQKSGDYKGHCDIVVEVLPTEVQVIGGNVGNSVTRRPLALNSAGFLAPVTQHGEPLFALMQNRIA